MTKNPQIRIIAKIKEIVENLILASHKRDNNVKPEITRGLKCFSYKIKPKIIMEKTIRG